MSYLISALNAEASAKVIGAYREFWTTAADPASATLWNVYAKDALLAFAQSRNKEMPSRLGINCDLILAARTISTYFRQCLIAIDNDFVQVGELDFYYPPREPPFFQLYFFTNGSVSSSLERAGMYGAANDPQAVGKALLSVAEVFLKKFALRPSAGAADTVGTAE